MPRGNDSAAALADLRGEFAGAGGSAEDLIASSRAALSPDLRTALNTPRETRYNEDLGADELVPVNLDKVQKEVGDEGVVLSAAKRGPFVVAVVEAESGRTYKQVLSADSVGFEKARKRPALAASEDAQEDTDVLTARMQGMADAKRIEREAEEAAREAREKVMRSYQEKGADDGGPDQREGQGEEVKESGSGKGSSGSGKQQSAKPS